MEINKTHHGDSKDLIPQLDDKSISLVVTSPPYAMQREKLYGGIPEEDYPDWMCGLMKLLWPKLTDDGSVLIVIRTNIRNGEISDYVMRTRLAIRASGWKECEELIWLKTDAPPLGSTKRPRRSWENILWFSKSAHPFTDLKVCGNPKSKRIGFAGSDRFGQGGDSPIAAKQNRDMREGTSKVADHFVAYIGQIEKGVLHPAMYPVPLCEKLIQTFSPPGTLILDPFMGSGQTAIAAMNTGRNFIGFEINPEYVAIAEERVRKEKPAGVVAPAGFQADVTPPESLALPSEPPPESGTSGSSDGHDPIQPSSAPTPESR